MTEKMTLSRWTKAIKDRDGWACIYCGSTERIAAHHIEGRMQRPEKELDLDNGVTLCRKHHLEAHGGYYSGQGQNCDTTRIDTYIWDYIERKYHGAPDWGFPDYEKPCPSPNIPKNRKREDMTQEQKQKQNRQNAQSRARYEAKAYDKMLLRIRKDGKDGVTADDIRAAAEASGKKLNVWILDAIKSKIAEQ